MGICLEGRINLVAWSQAKLKFPNSHRKAGVRRS